ncbi:hypothetical protein PV08_11147 [Exophiala spinifera]|uniref:RNase MRP protein 1 RNA binding domain-containing protein n=1 Tax=Exophiala spinifera TaxID=91928 RepID=A0A0D1Y5H7_9EURO|nr:uncharacterized protein PV08_11147 [Exophiala spinifera]KIW10186.1 hypothetical protein PV08_11147 [Exophiala spinifera]
MASKKSQSSQRPGTAAATPNGGAERPPKRRKLSVPSTPSAPASASGGSKRPQEKASKKGNLVKPTSKKRALPRPPRQRRSLRPQPLQRSGETPIEKPFPTTSKATYAKSNSGASTPLSPASDTSHKINFTKSLLDQIWTRNKNQHRTQPWWKCLGMLRKALTQLALLDDQETHVRQQHETSDGSARINLDAKEVRLRFEKEAQIRSERELWSEWVRETLVPRSYVAFTSLVSDTQFANLGVVLVGALADIASISGQPTSARASTATSKLERPVPSTVLAMATGAAGEQQPAGASVRANHRKATSLMAKSTGVTGLQSGEQVERAYESDDMGEVVERPLPQDKTHQREDSESSSKSKSQAKTNANGGPSSPQASVRVRKELYTETIISDGRSHAGPSDGVVPPVSDDDDEAATADKEEEEKNKKKPSVQNRPQSQKSRAQLDIHPSPSKKKIAAKQQPQPKMPTPPTASKLGQQKADKKTTSKDEKRKKKKTKGSAIDDLFAGLL